MCEKDMVMDILSGTKASIGSYAKIITECANQNLRTMFQQMRDADEKFQYDLYKIAVQKGYYVSAPIAPQNDLQNVKSQLMQSVQQPLGMR